MFTDKIEHILSNILATIGGRDIITKGIVTVRWSCNDYQGQLYTDKFNDVLYFTESSVNIGSATALAKSIKYKQGTWVIKKEIILFLLGILVSKERQQLTQIIFFHNYQSNMALEICLGFTNDWDQFQNIPRLTLHFLPYAQKKSQ